MLGIFGFYYVHFMNRVFYLLCIMLFLAVSCRKKQVILTQRYSIVAEKKPVVRLEHSDSITKSECLITTDGYQLPNSDFRQWHRVDCNRGSYEQIGVSQQDIWTITNSSYDNPCSNLPNQAKSTSDFCSSVPKAAMITTTVNNNFQDRLTGKNIVAGMLLTGKLDNSNKLELGVVYSGTPIAFSFTYKYKPGNFFHDNWGFKKNMQDSMDAYVVLEHREPGQLSKTLAMGRFRTSESQDECSNIQVPIYYAHNNQQPQELTYPSKQLVWGDSATLKPTHILVVFTSSYRGTEFMGAEGSTLMVNNFKLWYQCKN